jgi:hypothetical protein
VASVVVDDVAGVGGVVAVVVVRLGDGGREFGATARAVGGWASAADGPRHVVPVEWVVGNGWFSEGCAQVELGISTVESGVWTANATAE